MKTSKIKLSFLHNEEHFQFHTEFVASVAQYGAQTLNIEAAVGSYTNYYNQENQALQVIRKSATTEQLASADAERDDIFRGMVDAVKSVQNHFNADKRAAANRIKVLLDQYGNVARKPYDDETAAITKMVQELNGTYLADANAIAITEWITELDARNKAFDTLMKSRYSEEASKTELQMREVRAEVDVAYRAIADRLDALMLINGTANYEAFVRELNARVDRYSSIIAQRKGRNAKANTNAASSESTFN